MTEETRQALRQNAANLIEMLVFHLGGCGVSQPYWLWSFYDAPSELRLLSENGGDEDWLIIVPKTEPNPIWALTGTLLGSCSVDRIELPGEWDVLIGCHS